MNDRPVHKAELATILGLISLALIGTSVLIVVVTVGTGNLSHLTLSPYLAVAGLITAVFGMLVPHTSERPRPATLVVALFAGLALCCFYAFWVFFVSQLGKMH